MADLWHITEQSFVPQEKWLHSRESVFTIGNGYFGTRGTFEEGYPKAQPATLLFGVFDSVPIAKEELANTPDWTVVKLFVNGERFRLDRGTILSYERNLDMQHGLLKRTVHWQSPSGVRIRIGVERFANLADEHVAALRYSVTVTATPDNQPVEITLRATLDTAQSNQDLLHCETVDQGHHDGLLWLHSQTRQTLVQMAHTMSFTSTTPNVHTTIFDSDIAPSIHLSTRLAPGATLTAEKLVVLYTSRDEVEEVVRAALGHHKRLLAAAWGTEDVATAASSMYDQLFEQHRQAWADFWQDADVIVEGDELAQLGLRFSIYQLRISSSFHDSRYSIAAKGLTGFGYRGHVFQDTELFMLPFFTYTFPAVARNLLMYRYHGLPAARRKARANGYEGAQYPWESTLDGEEVTPVTMVHPETGEYIHVLNGILEIHITASIAYSVWEYWRVTGDDTFMRDYGAEILLSTAQFWVSRVEKRGDRYEILDVIGPDEWHEHVNNNAYTNYMAQRNIKDALKVLTWLQQTDQERAYELTNYLKLTPEHFAHWDDVQRSIYLPYDPETGLIEQFDGFFKLQPLDQSQYQGRTKSYQAVLGVDEVQKYRIIKQADVLFLLTVCSQDFDLKTKKANWDYYYPITDHDYGSSLTPALHVILACQLGYLEEARKLFRMGALVDLDDLRGNTAAGIHDACAGAVWQAAILGSAGLQIKQENYTTNPHLLPDWTRLAFAFKLRGRNVCIDLHAGSRLAGS